MAGKYNLNYFNGRGLAETARWMLAEGKVDYVDQRCEQKDWKADATMRSKTPFSQLPVLTLPNGVQIAQSGAIERYLARHCKLYGANDEESAKIDMVIEGLQDTMKGMIAIRQLKDENEKKAKGEAWYADATEGWPRWGAQLNALLKANGGTWFVGKTMTYADIKAGYTLGYIGANPKAFDSFPELAALVKRVTESPQIAAWIKKRPDTPF